ncbi:hypothetical protein CEXT_376251 [Caerostris extrusa]|uniref:Uncharacterized protein n=1 Tax=Caerostris extrusa TaxID=172846 RepID=A0AAV4NGR6_CAEEX|nr:hypothetical protein CEXT_376251 [Caerostris extrusa]
MKVNVTGSLTGTWWCSMQRDTSQNMPLGGMRTEFAMTTAKESDKRTDSGIIVLSQLVAIRLQTRVRCLVSWNGFWCKKKKHRFPVCSRFLFSNCILTIEGNKNRIGRLKSKIRRRLKFRGSGKNSGMHKNKSFVPGVIERCSIIDTTTREKWGLEGKRKKEGKTEKGEEGKGPVLKEFPMNNDIVEAPGRL